MKMDSKFFKRNRVKFGNKLKRNSVAVFFSKDVIVKGDSEFFDFPDSNLFYLTGISQAKTKLLVHKNSKGEINKYVFIVKTSKLIEVWEGAKLSVKESKAISLICNVKYLDEYEEIADKILSKTKNLYYFKNEELKGMENPSEYSDYIRKIKRRYKLNGINSFEIIRDLRQMKSKEEISEIRTAMKTTSEAFRYVLRNIKSYKSQQEVEASISYVYTKNLCKHSYHPIVASGKYANILHYIKNDKKFKKNELVLIDSGAEFNNYKTDITRTFPISGRFTKRQREVYRVVLDVQKRAIKMLKPNLLRINWERDVAKMILEKLIELSVITREEFEKNKDILRKYYPHRAGHFLGLDTHDLGDFKTPFQVGEVYTVEPGIYIKEEEIGVRIEDDVLITENGCEVLSKMIPKEIKSIED